VPDAARTAMIRELKTSLMDPAKAYDAALRLEALGLVAVSHLKEALASPHQIVRFSAAESLAYLGDARGLKELAKLAEADSLYRPYALAALASPKLPQSQLMLTKLLHAPGAETRYGAFRALWLCDHNDPLVMGEKLGVDRQTLYDVLSTSSASSFILSKMCPMPGPVPGSASSNGFKPGFAAKLMLKDLRLSQAAAQTAGTATPLGAAATAAFAMHVANGFGDLDMSSIVKLINPGI